MSNQTAAASLRESRDGYCEVILHNEAARFVAIDLLNPKKYRILATSREWASFGAHDVYTFANKDHARRFHRAVELRLKREKAND